MIFKYSVPTVLVESFAFIYLVHLEVVIELRTEDVAVSDMYIYVLKKARATMQTRRSLVVVRSLHPYTSQYANGRPESSGWRLGASTPFFAFI